MYSSDSKHDIWHCHCLRHHWIRLQKIFLRSSWICRQNCRVAKNSELKGAHFEIFQGFSSNFAKNVRFLYYREANKKRHVPLKVAPMCSKVHGFSHPGSSWFSFSTTGHGVARKSDLSIFPPNECWLFSAEKGDKRSSLDVVESQQKAECAENLPLSWCYELMGASLMPTDHASLDSWVLQESIGKISAV